jgi:heme/copper-type cytochrome/quinol oxidase subunit 1
MLWALGFIAIFTIGGLSGSSSPRSRSDWQVTDTYYVVAHMHYVMFGGGVFAVFAGLYFWWPKLFGACTGRGAREAPLLARVHRLQLDVLPPAHARADGHAEA